MWHSLPLVAAGLEMKGMEPDPAICGNQGGWPGLLSPRASPEKGSHPWHCHPPSTARGCSSPCFQRAPGGDCPTVTIHSPACVGSCSVPTSPGCSLFMPQCQEHTRAARNYCHRVTVSPHSSQAASSAHSLQHSELVGKHETQKGTQRHQRDKPGSNSVWHTRNSSPINCF